jgi:5S rRNA maturation endonuclease (ribonuclease M5)
MDYQKTLEELEKTLEELREANKMIPIIVEGRKDIDALHTLGITGEVIRYHRGLSISNFCDMISQQYETIILLTDWDKKGGYLCSMIKKNLESRVICNTRFREKIAKHSITRKVEGLPSWLQTLQKKVNTSS